MALLTTSLFGLFVNMTNISVPLTNVHYDIHVKSFAGHITINQTYRNIELTDLECVYGFPINDQAAIVGLVISIGNRTLTSQFKKKEEARKEYKDAVSRGDGAYLLDQSDRSDDTFVLSVGRLPPGKECTVSISYVNILESVTEVKMRLVIPTSLSPRYNLAVAANPSTTNSSVAIPEKYQDSVPYQATLLAHIEAIDTILNVTSPTHPIHVSRLGARKAKVIFAGEQQPLDRDLFIDIKLQNNPQHYVKVEKTKGDTYAALYAFVPHLKKSVEQNAHAEFIFVVDCSGSMLGNNKIGYAKQAMQSLLSIIPEGSYFNVFLFGSTFRTLFNNGSVLYTAESLASAKAYVDAMGADLGGTEILQPLQAIFAEAPRPDFSRQIFVLTDGEVTNTDTVINLVRANAANTRLFAFGLGLSPSRSLVNGIAAAGNGRAEFIKYGQDLQQIMARQLKRALQPAVSNVTLTWHGVKNVEQAPTVLPAVFQGDRQLVYAFFDLDEAPGAHQHIHLHIGHSKARVPIFLHHSEKDAGGKPFLDKLAARAMITQVEDTAPSWPVDPAVAEKITNLSLTYGVLSKYVSLIAVETRSEEERGNTSDTLALREVPIQKSGDRQFGGGSNSATSACTSVMLIVLNLSALTLFVLVNFRM